MLSVLLITAALSAPTVSAGDDPATLLWQGLAAHYAKADALDLDLRFQMEGDDSPYRCEIRLAKGLRGTALMTRRDEAIRFIGNGQGYYVLNDAQETYLNLPDGYMATPVVGYLGVLRTWAGAPAETPDSLRLIVAQPANPLVQVLEAEFPDRTETLWIGPDNCLLAASLDMRMGPVKIVGHVTFSRAAALRDIDPEDFAGTLPEGYFEVKGSEELLLPVGAEAPFTSLHSLDGKEFQLDDLRGKTVLLNFWFYT